MSTQHIETVIVGGGQAGLSTAYHLTRRGRECLVLDRNARVGDNWRQQWDTLRLYTPAKYDGLPGFPFPADPWEFPQKDQVADYLESYATRFELPVRTNTIVDRLESRAGGGYTLTLGDDTLTCDNVVIATGTFGRTPKVPAFATDLSPEILQLHSSAYRRPDQLQPGRCSWSALPIQVATSPSRSPRNTRPSCAARTAASSPCARESRSPCGAADPALHGSPRADARTPIGRKIMDEVRFHGGPMLRVKRADLDGRGVERTEAKVTGVDDGRPVLDDGKVVDVANVVWCTGFKQVFDWIRLPIFGDDGWPVELRGVVPEAPGLYFCGLSFQYAFSSMIFPGVGRDAEFVAKQISSRMRSNTTVMQPA